MMYRHVSDNWEKLVREVVKREQIRQLFHCDSLSSVSSSDCSSTTSRTASGDFSSTDIELIIGQQTPENYEKTKLPAGPQRRSKASAGSVKRRVQKVVRVVEPPKVRTNTNFGSKALLITREGYVGSLYFAQCLQSGKGKDIIINVFQIPGLSDSPDELLTQVCTVSMFKHENLVELLGYYVQGNLRTLAYEFATMGTLHDILHGSEGVRSERRAGPVLDWTQRVLGKVNPYDKFFRRASELSSLESYKIILRGDPSLDQRVYSLPFIDAARGLEYLHENSIMHGYIRSSNVLLYENWKTKIVDMNILNRAPDDNLNGENPLYYLLQPWLSIGYDAPEFSIKEKYTQKSDVYSFGVVLLEILTGRKPIDHTMPRGQQILVTWAIPNLCHEKVKECVDPKLKGEYPAESATKMADVARLCIQYEAKYRPNMTVVLKALQLLLESPALGI